MEKRVMGKTKNKEKHAVLNLLADSFYVNKSVNYIVSQDSKKPDRIKALMDYSYRLCSQFGKIYTSHNHTCAALIMYPDKKKKNLQSFLLDLKLIFTCTGFRNIKRAIQRESILKKHHPITPFTYLWFIGTTQSEQGKGLGTSLMCEIIAESEKLKRPIYLETSVERNIKWYEKLGFTVYKELDFGYKLYCMKRD
jgi:hypothetical protein